MENKVIFESEEEFDKFFIDCIQNNFHAEEIFKDVKKHGYIRKSAVEEAEEILNHNLTHNTEYIIIEKQRIILRAIQELKSEIERLKK